MADEVRHVQYDYKSSPIIIAGKEDVLTSEATTLLTLRARHGAGTHAEAASAVT